MGGVGSGKTYIGILKILYLLDLYPGSRAAIVRQRATQLKSTTAKTLWQLLPKEKIASRNLNEGSVTLKNGSEIVMRHLDKENSIDDLKSLEINFAYVDQMEDISARAWDTLLERLGRWSGAMMRGGFPANWPHKTRQGYHIPPKYALASAYSPGYDNARQVPRGRISGLYRIVP
jgi:phage terminase large subunit